MVQKKSSKSSLGKELTKEFDELKKEFREELRKEFKNNKKKKNDDPEALFIPAGVLSGLGAGFVFGNVPAGLFLGLGIGFCLFAIIAVIRSIMK